MEDESKTNQSLDEVPSIIESTAKNNPFDPEESPIKSPAITAQKAMIKPCQCGKPDCPSCSREGAMTSSQSFVYAIGKVVHRFPNKSLEEELKQAIGLIPGAETTNLANPEIVHNALVDPNNRYISRNICFVLTIQDIETYILVPSDPLDLDKLSQAIRSDPNPTDVNVIIGRRGSIAPPEMCNGLMVPIVMVDQIYSFDRDALIKSIPKQKGVNETQFKKTANAVFNKIIQITDNTGITREHRVLNYLAVRYDEIYHTTQKLQEENYSFTGVEVRPSSVSDTRTVLDVIFSYENRKNRAIQKWFARVDVTEQFPFLVTPLQEYFER
jgi:hypothetical protein